MSEITQLLDKWLMSVSNEFTDAPWQRVATCYNCIGALCHHQQMDVTAGCGRRIRQLSNINIMIFTKNIYKLT